MFNFIKKKLQNIIKKTAGAAKEEKKKPIKKEGRKPEKEEKAKSILGIKLGVIKISKEFLDDFLSKIEEVMLENNVAYSVIEEIRSRLSALEGKEVDKKVLEEYLKENLKAVISELFEEPFSLIERIDEKPFVIVFFGINGSGKTTTLAKVAYMLKKHGKSCVIAAADTFRAAAIEQLKKHGNNIGVEVISSKYQADPASVAFDAIAHAKARGTDVVLIDTAGRMHNQQDLMREMEKICRVAKPNLKIFVGEATTGNDAVLQAESFNKNIGIDAFILSKQDVDEKGGAALSISFVTKKPILFLGTGQNYGDLEKFHKEKLLKQLGL